MSLKEFVRPLVPNRAYRAYRARKLNQRIASFQPYQATHSYGGHQLTVQFRDAMAAGWYDSDKPVPADFALMREHGLRPGATVFDLGAFQGIVALMLAREAEPGSVVAVEGTPHNARMAEENRVLNRADNLTVINAAVAERPGRISFAADLNGKIGEGGLEVDAVTIDRLADRHGVPDVVYLDVEGHEIKALRGAASVLSNHHATWSIEVHGDDLVGGTAQDLLAMLDGYRVWVAPETPVGAPTHYKRLDGTLPSGRFFIVAAP